MLTLGFVLMVVGVGFFALAFGISISAFRLLVDLERTDHPQVWSADGKPSPQPFPDSVSSYFANFRALNSWLLSRPAWLAPGSKGSETHGRMVRWFLLSALGIIVFAIGVFLFGNAVIAA